MVGLPALFPHRFSSALPTWPAWVTGWRFWESLSVGLTPQSCAHWHVSTWKAFSVPSQLSTYLLHNNPGFTLQPKHASTPFYNPLPKFCPSCDWSVYLDLHLFIFALSLYAFSCMHSLLTTIHGILMAESYTGDIPFAFPFSLLAAPDPFPTNWFPLKHGWVDQQLLAFPPPTSRFALSFERKEQYLLPNTVHVFLS